MSRKGLTREEERILIDRWQAGDERAGVLIFKAFENYLHGWARGYEKYGPDHGDLYQVACCGVLNALSRFDTSMEARLSSYMKMWIRVELDMYVLANSRQFAIGTSLYAKKLFFRLSREIILLRRADPSMTEGQMVPVIAKRLNVPERKVNELMPVLLSSAKELDRNLMDGEGGTAGDYLVDDGPSPEEDTITVMDAEIEAEAIRNAIQALDERERKIIRGRFLRENKKTLDALSVELDGISKERVRQLEVRAIRKLRESLSRDPVFGAYA